MEFEFLTATELSSDDGPVNKMKCETCKHSDLESFGAYLASLSSPVDSFLEDHILESQFHRIVNEGQEIGSFAIHNGSLLTQFHIVGRARRYGQEVFSDVLRQHKPEAAFVPTCDEFFLSHALDRYADLMKQALFFIDGGQPIDSTAAASPKVDYRPAAQSDIPSIKAMSGTFVDDPEGSISRHEIHVGHLNDKLVAIGLIVQSRLWENQASIGMFTCEAHRRQSIGTRTVLYLKHVCRSCGITPLAGCGYGNTNSQLTLQAAGMVTVTRLLRFTF
ncbi:MAG: hypothetical protein QGG53_29190 [Planctomycetota bacterium]|nr:hypothetical protein [Planctomycetota bacterium]